MYDVTQYRDLLEQINRKIWEAAETKYEEFESARLLTQALKDAGFAVEEGIGGIPTAFTARYGSGKPVIGLLAEYDALDGVSQQADCTTYSPRPETTHGHGCGHHLLGTGVIGAALALKGYLDDYPGGGTLIVYGCPAEEGGSGKPFMARTGCFDCLDIALTWHPGTMNAAMTGSLLANTQLYFRFHGVSSHAGAAPQRGRSALDAVELMNVGVNYMREHMEMTDSIHYAVTNTGGVSPNVVQAEAEVLYLIRSKDNESVRELLRRVTNIAKGAALMTETTMDTCFVSAVSNVVPNDVLGQLFYETMEEIGVPTYTQAEQDYIMSFRKVIGDEAANNDLGMLPAFDLETRRTYCTEHPMGDFILPFEPQNLVETASSDMGDVSQIVPLLQLQCACFCLGTPPHSWLQTAQGLSSYAIKGMLFAAQTMVNATIRLMKEPALVEAAQQEHHRRTGGKPYLCPIPPEEQPKLNRQ